MTSSYSSGISVGYGGEQMAIHGLVFSAPCIDMANICTNAFESSAISSAELVQWRDAPG